jgi:hypothetical protein
MLNEIDFDAATGLLTRGEPVQRMLAGVPRLIFERLLAEQGGFVHFSELRRICDRFGDAEGEAAVCTGIKKLREQLIPFDVSILHTEGRGYRLKVLPKQDRAARPLPDVAQRVANRGVGISEAADAMAAEAHRSRDSAERFATILEDFMRRGQRAAAAVARELSTESTHGR